MKLFGGAFKVENTGLKFTTLLKFGALIVGAVVVVGTLFMLLWNWIMPEVFGLGQVNFIQGFGILFLAKLIFSYDGTVKVKNNSKHSSEVVKVEAKSFESNVENDQADEMYEKWWTEEGEAYFETYLENKLQSDM